MVSFIFARGKTPPRRSTVDAPCRNGLRLSGQDAADSIALPDNLLFTDDRLQLSESDRQTLFRRTLRGTADISLAKDDPHYPAKIAVEGVDFPRLTDLYFKYETARGRLERDLRFHGAGERRAHHAGQGKSK